MKRSHGSSAALLLAAVTLSACSISIGGSTMDAEKVEKSGRNFLKGKLGEEKFDEVTCPDGEDAEEGNVFTCDFEGSDGTTGTLKVEVTSDDGDATLTVASVAYTSDYVEEWISTDFAAENPQIADVLQAVECPSDFPSEVGDTVTCVMVDTDGKRADLTVTVGDQLDLTWDFAEIIGS